MVVCDHIEVAAIQIWPEKRPQDCKTFFFCHGAITFHFSKPSTCISHEIFRELLFELCKDSAEPAVAALFLYLRGLSSCTDAKLGETSASDELL